MTNNSPAVCTAETARRGYLKNRKRKAEEHSCSTINFLSFPFSWIFPNINFDLSSSFRTYCSVCVIVNYNTLIYKEHKHIYVCVRSQIANVAMTWMTEREFIKLCHWIYIARCLTVKILFLLTFPSFLNYCYSIIECFGLEWTFRSHLVAQPPLQWTGTSLTRSGCVSLALNVSRAGVSTVSLGNLL